MRCLKFALGLAVPRVLCQAASSTPQRMGYAETKRTIERIRDQSSKFKDNFELDISKSGLDLSGSHERKREINRFEESAERLKKNYHKENAAVSSVSDVLSQASVIGRFMAEHPVTPRVQDEWLLLRQDLDLLAGFYGMTTNWPSVLARTEWESPVATVRPDREQMLGLINIFRQMRTHSTRM